MSDRTQHEVSIEDLEHDLRVLQFAKTKRNELQDALKEVEAAEAEALANIQEALLAAHPDAVGGEHDNDVVAVLGGEPVVRWTTTHQTRFDSAKVKEIAPDLYAQLSKRVAVKRFQVLV